ncbi:MAG: TIGR02597 family protein [Verrucomicrobiae bacterium]|nr:TIGR02597 family protein [Verrucomicrobiae bacterium]
MKQRIKQMATVGLLLWPALLAHGGPTVGYNYVDVPPSSDFVMAIPFRTEVMFTGAVASVTANSITVTGTPFTPGEYANLFYVRYTSGAKNGQWATITANTANTLTLAYDTAGVSVGDTFQIEAHWTLGTAFPAWLEGTSFINSTGTAPAFRRTEVRLIDEISTGLLNRPAGGGGTFFFGTHQTNGFWRSTAAPSANANNTVLKPMQYLVVRNQGTNVTLRVFTLGEVDEGRVGTRVRRDASDNDVPVSSGRPVPVSLAELGLAGTPAFTSSPNALPPNRRDEVRLFDNLVTGFNKPAGGGGTYFHRSDLNIWVSAASPGVDVSNQKIIQPSQGFVIRRKGGTALNAEWSNNPPY